MTYFGVISVEDDLFLGYQRGRRWCAGCGGCGAAAYELMPSELYDQESIRIGPLLIEPYE